jgi:integrase
MRYRVAKHKRGFVCVIYEPSGNRRRIALKASDKFAATAAAAELVGHIEQRKPRQRLTVGQIVEMYLEQSEAIWKDVDRFHWKHGERAFGRLSPSDVGEKECRAFAGASSNRSGSIRKVLSILRAALRWAERKSLIDKAPHIWLPQAPPPKDRRLTREEASRLRDGVRMPHVRLFVEIALGTGARAGAILGLRWSDCDLENKRLNLGGHERQKARAKMVPINETLYDVLVAAREGAMTDHVIEWAGQPVKSIKRGFREAVKRAGLGADVTPHVLRHTAASWMAEAGVPMSEIAAVLGHRDSRTTERVYARYSPEYLQRAVRALG